LIREILYSFKVTSERPQWLAFLPPPPRSALLAVSFFRGGHSQRLLVPKTTRTKEPLLGAVAALITTFLPAHLAAQVPLKYYLFAKKNAEHRILLSKIAAQHLETSFRFPVFALFRSLPPSIFLAFRECNYYC